MIGKTLNHYKIVAFLGRGGMGEVWIAEDTRLGRKVALKTLPSRVAAEPNRRARFEREARAIAALNHPNIVTIHSVEEAGGVAFLTMELIEGKTLSDVIPPKGLPLDRFFNLAIPLASALAAAHHKGITHRDLKPANVMVTADGRVKVLDFGLAKLAETAGGGTGEEMTTAAATATQEGKIVGTAAYMSPEQAEGRPVDARSDVFSLGVVMYEMATGERPFKGDTTISTITSILRDDPPSIGELKPDTPRHLGRLVQRCLAKDPDRRYQAALDVRNELEGLSAEIDSGELVVTTSGSGLKPAPRAASSRKSVWIAAAAIGALALVAAGIVLWPKPPSGTSRAVSIPHLDRNLIAVFPFVNISENAQNTYFCDGLSEELIHALGKIPGLQVAAPSSPVQPKEGTRNMAEIGRELGVTMILEGSVRRAGDRVRVTVKLISAKDEVSMWTETYDRELRDVFAIQEDLAGKIADALRVRLLGAVADAAPALR
jgi:non-specific serine/threonine protein kinase